MSLKRKRTLLPGLVLILIAIIASACQGDATPKPAEGSPEATYWAYYEACQQKHYETAEKYLSETARQRAAGIGVCGFTHDAINEVEVSQGGLPRTFSAAPEIFTEGDSAVITWLDDQGNIATLLLVRTDSHWKITESLWSK